MSSAVDNAHYVIMPGSVAVVAVTTGSQALNLSTRTELGHLEGGRYLSIMVEQDTWVNFTVATGTASATATSGARIPHVKSSITRLSSQPPSPRLTPMSAVAHRKAR